MGKFILCTGRIADKPLHFALTDSDVYSIEELCYYLYENIYTITEETFHTEMAVWLREELYMEELADRLLQMLDNQNGIKDIIVSIFCSSDYYTEEEIKEAIKIIDSIDDLPLWGRRKMKADNYLRYKKYTEAAKEYEKILHSRDAFNLDVEEYGNILHNLAIAHVHTRTLRSAALEFKEAYSRNQNEESLKQYLIALKLGKFEQEFEDEVVYYQVSEEKVKVYMDELDDILTRAEKLPVHRQIRKFAKLKEDGKVSEYYENIEKLIYQWKQEYKKEVGSEGLQ